MKKKETKYPVLVAEMKTNKDTQESLGKILGINRMTVGMKLMGKYDWTISEIDKLCIYYGKDYYELFKGE